MPTPNVIWAEPFALLGNFVWWGASYLYNVQSGSPSVGQNGRGTGANQGWGVLGSGSAGLGLSYNRIHATPSAQAGQQQGLWFSGSAAIVHQYWEVQGAVAVCHVSIQVDAAGFIVAYRGASGVELGRSTNTLTAYGAVNWDNVESTVTINGTTGTVDVEVEGVNWLSLTGKNTFTTGTGITGVVNQHRIQVDTGMGVTDWIWTDGTGMLGVSKRALWRPFAAVGTYSDGTPNTGTIVTALDDISFDGDATYVAIDATTLPNAVSGTTTPLPANTVSVQAVIPMAIARKSDTGGNAGEVGIRSSTTEVVSAAPEALGTAYTAKVLAPQQVDPATSAAWTISGRDASEVLYRRTA